MVPLSPTKLGVLWNTLSQLVGKFFSAGTMFLVSLLLARQFGAEGYGDFTKITTFVAFFFLLADFGLNAVYLQKNQDTNAWTPLLSLRVVGSIGVTFVAVSILAFIPQGTAQGYTGLVRLGIIVFAPAIIFQALITTVNAVFQERLRYDYATVAVFVGSLITLLFVWVLTLIGATNILLAVVALLVGSATTALVGLWLVRSFVPSFHLTLGVVAFRSLFLPALPLGLTLLFNLVYFHIDSVILTLTRSTVEVGLYGLAYKIFEVPLVIPTFFMNAVYPLFLSTTNNKQQTTNNFQQFKKLFRSSFWLLVVSSLLLIVVVWMAAPLLSIIRPEFAASTGALRVLSLGLPFFFLTSLTMWTMIALKRQTILAVIYGGSMVVNILLNAWLVPTHGFMAAAWVTVGSEALVLIASGVVLQRYLRNI